jgi:hypothetical protein
MIRLFINFLYKICGISKKRIRASILIYPDINEKISKEFWIKQSKLSNENFNKSIVIKGRHKTKRTRYGVCTVGICSTYLKEKIRVWLKMLPKELVKEIYYSRG